MKKRLLLLTMIGVLLISVAACGDNIDELSDGSDTADTSNVASTVESDDSPVSAFSEYLADILVPAYGYKELSHSTEFYSELLEDGDYSEWVDADGIMSADIVDLDGDGSDELFVVRMGNNNYLADNTDQHPIYMDAYEEQNGIVTCVAERIIDLADDSVVYYTDSQHFDNAFHVSLSQGDHPLIFAEYSENGVFADGWYQCYMSYEYDGEKFLKVADVAQDYAGSDDESEFHGYKYENDSEVSKDLIEKGTYDSDDFGNNVSDYYSEYNISFDISKMDYSSGAKEESVLLNRSESSEEVRAILDYCILYDEDSSIFDAILNDYSDAHNLYPRKIPGDGETYGTYDGEIIYLKSEADGVLEYREPEDNDTILIKNEMYIHSGNLFESMIVNNDYSYYVEEKDGDFDYAIWKQELNEDSEPEKVVPDVGPDIELIGIYNNRLYCYSFDPEGSGYNADICYYDLSTKEKTDTNIEANYSGGYIHDHYIYYKKDCEDGSMGISENIYDLETGETAKLCDYAIRLGGNCTAYGDNIYSNSDHIYYAVCDEKYKDAFVDYGMFDGYEDTIEINIVEASPNGEDKNIVVSNLEVRDVINITDKAIVYIDKDGEEVLLVY